MENSGRREKERETERTKHMIIFNAGKRKYGENLITVYSTSIYV